MLAQHRRRAKVQQWAKTVPTERGNSFGPAEFIGSMKEPEMTEEQRLKACVGRIRAILDDRSIDVTAVIDERGNWKLAARRGPHVYDLTVRPGAPTQFIVAAIERWAVK